MGVPAGWTDDGHTLHAPNGQPVILGKREYILSHPWDPGNVPLNAAYYPEHILPSDPTSGAGSRQEFRDVALVYDKTAASPQVQPAPYGPDYVALLAVIEQQRQQIATLQAQLSAAEATPPAPGAVQFKQAIEALDAALTAYRSSSTGNSSGGGN